VKCAISAIRIVAPENSVSFKINKILSLPKMSSDANALELSDIREDDTEAPPRKPADQCNK